MMHKIRKMLRKILMFSLFVLGCAAVLCLTVRADNIDGADQAQRQMVMQDLNRMPLSFTENQGQFGDKICFRANAPGASFFFSPEEVIYQFTRRYPDEEDYFQLGKWRIDNLQSPFERRENSRLASKIEHFYVKAKFIGANPKPEIVGEGSMAHKCNYFIGNDPSKWRTDVSNYRAVVYKDIYPGIDLKYYGDGRAMKYDFIVSPGADPSQIQVRYEGIKSLQVNQAGELIVETKFGRITEHAPHIFQIIDGVKKVVQGGYSSVGQNTFGFKLTGTYNSSQCLIIDPTLTLGYSTYLGGSDRDIGVGIAVDVDGNAYVTGYTWSSDFPTENPFDGTIGWVDGFVTKFSLSGNSLIYSTYLGGNNSDGGLDIAIDATDNAYVTGETASSDFPIVNPFDGTYNGNRDGFVTKLSPSGNSLVYSTYLGGGANENGYGIAVDSDGSAYVTGITESSDFPTENPFDGTLNGDGDGFVTKFSLSGNSLIYSTYLGGSSSDDGYGIAVDADGNAYVTGETKSSNFPTENPFDGTHNGYGDAFVTKFSDGGTEPPTHAFVDSVRVWKHESGSYRIKLPNDLDSIEVDDRIRFYGRVTDESGSGVPYIQVTAFNAFEYDGSKNPGLSNVVTDGSGNFIFPDPNEEEIGLLCEFADLFPFWFAASDSVAIPIILEVFDQTMTLEGLTDSLIAIYEPIFSDMTDDTVFIGIPDTTDPLVIKFHFYPPNPLDLDDPINNDFMEGFAYTYHGPTDFGFLFDSTFADTMAWLTRGSWLNNSRAKGVVDTLKNYFLEQVPIRVLAYRDEFGQWHNVANQQWVIKGFWDNVVNAITYGIEAGICAASIVGTLGVGAPLGCAPLVIHVAADVTKAVVVPRLYDDVFTDVDPEHCRSVGNTITDIGAGIANICVGGGIKNMVSGTKTHLGWWANPRNLAGGGLAGRCRAGAELYSDLVGWAGVGQTAFNTDQLAAHYFQYPGGPEHQSYGFDGFTYEPDDPSHMLYGTEVGSYITMVDPPLQFYDVVYCDPLNPFYIIVKVKANKPFYEDGTTELIPPTIVIENDHGSHVVDPATINMGADSSLYWALVLTSELPGWVPGQPWFGKIMTGGPDIVSNLGEDSTSFGGAPYSGESDLTLTLEDGSNVFIPENALDTSLYLSLGPSYQIGGGKLQDMEMFPSRFLGSEYKLAPTDLEFDLPISVGLKLDTLEFGDLGDSLLALIQFDSLAMAWTVIGTDIDSINSIINGSTLKAGRFHVALMVEYLLGDANGDGAIDIGDVMYLINYLFIGASAPEPLEAGDANCDGLVDVGDVVYLINYLFIDGPPPGCP